MIERGALIVHALPDGARYRGLHRPPLDAVAATGRRGRDIVQEYREALFEGEGAIYDLDVAMALCARAARIGMGTPEVIVFEAIFDEEAQRIGRSLPMALQPPAPGLTLLGYDVCDLIEPYCSALRELPPSPALNDAGLLIAVRDAVALAQKRFKEAPDDETHAVRLWVP